MTLIMIWKEISAKRAWIVSDSRLSNAGPVGGRIRRTDRAAKTLEIKIASIVAADDQNVLQSRSVGFAYAGSSLIALQAYSAVTPLWSRLVGWPWPASNDEMRDAPGKILEAYGLDVAAAGGSTSCHCYLICYDENAQRIEAFQVTAVLDATNGRRQPQPTTARDNVGMGARHNVGMLPAIRAGSVRLDTQRADISGACQFL